MLALQVMVLRPHTGLASCRFWTGTGYYFHTFVGMGPMSSILDKGLGRGPDHSFLFLVLRYSRDVASPFDKLFFVTFLLYHKLQNKVPISTPPKSSIYQLSVFFLTEYSINICCFLLRRTLSSFTNLMFFLSNSFEKIKDHIQYLNSYITFIKQSFFTFSAFYFIIISFSFLTLSTLAAMCFTVLIRNFPFL